VASPRGGSVAGAGATTRGTLRWTVRLPAVFGHADITPQLEALVSESGMRTGVLTVQLLGSTGAITTIEYEAGALSDLKRALDVVAPVDAEYAHNARWGDGNGFSHVRSALLKTSLSLPVVDGELMVGTWQQVVAINLDNRERERELVAVLVGSA
jgi:secondary thiamine-phosphate synthase enzyme